MMWYRYYKYMWIDMWYHANMKAIQVTFDEDLLAQIDELAEVRELGRSAVLRRAAADYLAQKRAEEIDRHYEEGYRRFPAHEDPDLEGWSHEGVWLED